MNEDSNVARLRQPEEIDDPLTAILRSGARRLLEQAIEAELAAFPSAMRDIKLPDGCDRMVRHGHGPDRTVQTGIGPAAVRRAKIHDRDAEESGERIRFTSAILPRWARRSKSLDALLPVLMVFKLITGAAKTGRRLQGENMLAKVILGVTFHDGAEVTETASQSAA